MSITKRKTLDLESRDKRTDGSVKENRKVTIGMCIVKSASKKYFWDNFEAFFKTYIQYHLIK